MYSSMHAQKQMEQQLTLLALYHILHLPVVEYK